MLSLDYPYCRARAWLEALDSAQTLLPDNLAAQAGAPALNVKLGGQAAAALLFPVETATPDFSLGEEIKVYLESRGFSLAEALAALGPQDRIPLQMAALLEIGELLALTERNWPESLREADERTANLETLASALSGLWLIRSGDRPDAETLARALEHAPSSLLAAFWDAVAALDADLPQTALEKAASVERRAEALARTDPENGAIWRHLAARASLVRGNAHLRLGQPALAERAFSEALSGLDASGWPGEIRGAALIARAESRRDRRDFAGMCADYQQACGAGQCAPLALARRNGQCGPDAP